MTRDEYLGFLSNLNYYQLYLTARRFEQNNLAGLTDFEWKSELIYKECNSRHPDIFHAAREDAEMLHFSRIARQSGVSIKDVIRPSLLSQVEFSQMLRDNNVSFPPDSNNIIDSIRVQGQNRYILCKVSGDSMIDAGINDNDFIVVEKKNYTKGDATDFDGKVVIASIEGLHFIKRFRLINGEKWLYSENMNYKPYLVGDDTEFKILGIVKMTMQTIN